jgi:hypothetical protein
MAQGSPTFFWLWEPIRAVEYKTGTMQKSHKNTLTKTQVNNIFITFKEPLLHHINIFLFLLYSVTEVTKNIY